MIKHTIILSAIALMLSGCNSTQQNEQVQNQEPTEQNLAEEATSAAQTGNPQIENEGPEVVKGLFSKYVLGDGEVTEENLKQYCTDKMIKYLYDSYEYDGEGIAIWRFRGTADGLELLLPKLTSIESLGGNKFRVNYVNGREGTEAHHCDVLAVLVDGKVLIDEIVE
ncbi:MAG: hypothetical protein IK005_10375 [Paludibacteraceae bacterium]|nr:hypothetical protein [Paludibacteraceae bacterium]